MKNPGMIHYSGSDKAAHQALAQETKHLFLSTGVTPLIAVGFWQFLPARSEAVRMKGPILQGSFPFHKYFICCTDNRAFSSPEMPHKCLNYA